MRVAVIGLGHLGTVVAACLAEAGFDVGAWDPGGYGVGGNEPGLPTLPARANSPQDAIAGAEAIWLTADTPLTAHGPDVDAVFALADKALIWASSNQPVLVSSQMPVGSVRRLAEKYPHLKFFCSPENLRRGQAVANFKSPGRVIIGTPDYPNETIARLFQPFCQKLFWCSVESAEFAKHALNAMLAAQITLANELGEIAVKHGANPGAIEYALKSDPRIGEHAYVTPGKGGIGPHLARDIGYLSRMSASPSGVSVVNAIHFGALKEMTNGKA